MPLLDYQEVLKKIAGRRAHLLLGNGFSIACDPIFRYQSLYERAVKDGLSTRAQRVFEKIGTNNFEGVMRLLEDADWIARAYELEVPKPSPMTEDVEVVKRTLIDSISASHLATTAEVGDEKKANALRFLSDYHNVFTTNYDLLTYWVNMHDGNPPFQDGFRPDDDDPDGAYLVFSERVGDARGMFYLHGALHFYIGSARVHKHSWVRSGTPLIEAVREGLDGGHYPLFVAEGTAEKKFEQIQSVGYLWYCLSKLSRIAGPLVVFGHSLGHSDAHIRRALGENPQLSDILVGLFGDPDSEANMAIADSIEQLRNLRDRIAGKRRRSALNVAFFDAGSAHVWG